MNNTVTAKKNAYSMIDEMNISRSWRKKFKAIYIAYYQNFFQGQIKHTDLWTMGNHVNSLSFFNKLKFNARANFPALLFGPLYYFYKGMFLKGLVLAILTFVLANVNQITLYCVPFIFLYCCFAANIDYFYSKFLKEAHALAAPASLNDYYDKNFFQSMLDENPIWPLTKQVVILLVFVLTSCMIYSKYLEIDLMKSFNSVEKVCNDAQSCVKVIKDIEAKLSTDSIKESVASYTLGCAHYYNGNHDRALDYYSKAKVEDPSNIKVYAASAQVYYQRHKYKNAIQTYEQILMLNPNLTFVNYYIGRVYYKTKKYKKALGYFEKAIKDHPNELDFVEALAYTQLQLKMYEKGKENLDKTIELLKKDGRKKNAEKIKNLVEYMKNLR